MPITEENVEALRYYKWTKIFLKKLALRKKIRQEEDSTKNLSGATRVIILNGDETEISTSEISNILEEKNKISEEISWAGKYDTKFKKNQKLLDYYLRVIEILSKNINSKDSLASEIRSALRDNSFNKKGYNLNRENRRIIVSRLISLLINFEPLFDSFKDKEVVRVILSDKVYPRVFSRTDSMTAPKWFVSYEESLLLNKVLNLLFKEKDDPAIITNDKNNFSLLVFKISENEFAVFRKAQKTSVMLDLIRNKFLSPQIARSITKLLSNKGSGLVVSGASHSGKTQLLSAVLSSLPLNVSPLVIGVGDILKKVNPHSIFLDKKDLFKVYTNETFSSLITRSGIGVIIVDEMDADLFSYLCDTLMKYKIPIISSINGIDFKSTISLDYKNEIFKFTSIFQYVAELHKSHSSNYVKSIHECINSNNELKTINLIKINDSKNIPEWESTGLSSHDSIFNYSSKVKDS